MEEPPACCPEPPRSRGTTDHGSEAIEIESLLDLSATSLPSSRHPAPRRRRRSHSPRARSLPVENRRARCQRNAIVRIRDRRAIATATHRSLGTPPPAGPLCHERTRQAHGADDHFGRLRSPAKDPRRAPCGSVATSPRPTAPLCVERWPSRVGARRTFQMFSSALAGCCLVHGKQRPDTLISQQEPKSAPVSGTRKYTTRRLKVGRLGVAAASARR
jgi:hypothetical protein